jgi:hypothetical protein
MAYPRAPEGSTSSLVEIMVWGWLRGGLEAVVGEEGGWDLGGDQAAPVLLGRIQVRGNARQHIMLRPRRA